MQKSAEEELLAPLVVRAAAMRHYNSQQLNYDTLSSYMQLGGRMRRGGVGGARRPNVLRLSSTDRLAGGVDLGQAIRSGDLVEVIQGRAIRQGI
jgi:hypothetical protein